MNLFAVRKEKTKAGEIMSRRLKIASTLFSAILLIAASDTKNVEWISVITVNDIQMSIDTKSIEYPAFQVAKGWRKYEFDPPMKQDLREFSAVHVYSEEDCAGDKFRVLEEIMELTDGTTDKKTYTDPPWENIAPGTFNQHFHSFVCK